jgi:hypothetical protein
MIEQIDETNFKETISTEIFYNLDDINLEMVDIDNQISALQGRKNDLQAILNKINQSL